MDAVYILTKDISKQLAAGPTLSRASPASTFEGVLAFMNFALQGFPDFPAANRINLIMAALDTDLRTLVIQTAAVQPGNWEAVLTSLRAVYYPRGYLVDVWTKLHEPRGRKEPFDTYFARKEMLLRNFRTMEYDDLCVVMGRAGLFADEYNALANRDFAGPREMVDAALEFRPRDRPRVVTYGEPMDVDQVEVDDVPSKEVGINAIGRLLSAEERTKCLQDKLCFKCKKAGHFSRNCPGFLEGRQ